MKLVPPHSDKWPDHLKFHKMFPDMFYYLEEDDIYRTDDIYGGVNYGYPYRVGNHKETSLKEGDLVHPIELCYLPRRYRKVHLLQMVFNRLDNLL